MTEYDRTDMSEHRPPSSADIVMHGEQYSVRPPPVGADAPTMFQHILEELQRSADSRHRWQTNVSGTLMGMQVEIKGVKDRQEVAKENCRNHAELAESVRSVHQLLEGAFGKGGMVSDLANIRTLTYDIRQDQVAIKLQLNQYAADQANMKAILDRHETALHEREADCTRISTALTPAPDAWWLTQVKTHAVTVITTIAISALMFGALPAAKQFLGIATEPTKTASTPAQTHTGP
jgi:hypothetical protein